MSFFDEGDGPTTPARPQPRRPATAAAPPPDQQTLRTRQAIGLGAVVLVAILLVVGVRGCLSSQKKRSLREYNRNVSALVEESDDQVGKPLFQLLGGGSSQGGATNNTNQLEPQINQLRIEAESLVKRAKHQDVPGDMKSAQQNFLLVLELRRDAIAKIAAKLPTARAQAGADQAVSQITGQMLALSASDVVYKLRVIPYIKRALDDAGVKGQTIADTQFFPDVSWLDSAQVANRIGASIKNQNKGPAAPGSHGHALESVSVGNTSLQEGSGNKLSAGSGVVFTVKFANQGENDESNVNVKVTIEGSGRPITVTKTVPLSKAGTETTTEIPLGQSPPIGQPVTINVEVQAVPGEADSDNNKASYPALFSQ